MKVQLSKSQLNKLLNFLLEKINHDEFIIIKREKNNRFMNEYRLNKERVKLDILLKISSENFISEEFDNDTIKYGTEKVAIFIVKCNLVDVYGENKDLSVYVKIKEKINSLVMISVHEEER